MSTKSKTAYSCLTTKCVSKSFIRHYTSFVEESKQMMVIVCLSITIVPLLFLKNKKLQNFQNPKIVNFQNSNITKQHILDTPNNQQLK